MPAWLHAPATARLVFATLLVTLGVTSPAAAVDLSGDYVGFALVPFTVTFVQTGTALQMIGHVGVNSITYPLSAAGTVDPATGAFSVAGEITGLCADFVYSGTGDGEETSGTYTSRTCPSGPVLLSKCGNGVIDPLENCEDGNHADGDCCSARCRLDVAGTACTSDGNDCTADVCNATGTCTHLPITAPCDDGNECTIGDVCSAGACVPGSPAPAGTACNGNGYLDLCTDNVCDAAGTCTHVAVPAGECRRAVACHSTCTEQLKACRQTCPGAGPARRECRAACAARSTCTAPGAPIRTLAYVVTECTRDPQGRSSLKQKLLIRHGNCDPLPAVALDEAPPQPDPSGLCRGYGEGRFGIAAQGLGLLQRLAVLPDGSGVVFEVTSLQVPLLALRRPPEEGFFFVRANGKGLRRLGPASRLSPWQPPIVQPLRAPDFFPVSPDGRKIALQDLGPDRAGHDVPQLFLLDTRSGERRQLTHQSNPDPDGALCCAQFLNSRTILFHMPPGGPAFTVKTDGKRPEKELPVLMLPGGGSVIKSFEVSGARPHALFVYFPTPPARGEEFLLDGKNFVQLTNFGRLDTSDGFVHRGRVLFSASANLRGENPHEICQLFSVNTRGADLHQVTHLPWDGRPSNGCFSGGGRPTSCNIRQLGTFLDPITGTALFQSSCDPLGANPFGEQLFAMRLDGTGLRQLTNARGMTTDPDGTIRVELPGPAAYTSPPPG
jgi:cysteine-rich repeat protein